MIIFESYLTFLYQVSNFEAAGALAKNGSIVKTNQHQQIQLAQISETKRINLQNSTVQKSSPHYQRVMCDCYNKVHFLFLCDTKPNFYEAEIHCTNGCKLPSRHVLLQKEVFGSQCQITEKTCANFTKMTSQNFESRIFLTPST